MMKRLLVTLTKWAMLATYVPIGVIVREDGEWKHYKGTGE